MATDLALDDNLVNEAVEAGHHKSRQEAVTAALKEYVRIKARQRLLELEGTIEFDPAWDYKEARRRGNKRIPKD